MHSENVSSADNQQERLEMIGWVVGFVDGEGSFTVSILKNSTSSTGWQVFPEFIVTQGAKSKSVLYSFKEFFGCGEVYVNRRFDNHKQHLYRYCVRSLKDLSETIIPFFNMYSLKTNKRKDFRYFTKIMKLIDQRRHLDLEGIKLIAEIAMKMNRKIKPKFLESPQTIRQINF